MGGGWVRLDGALVRCGTAGWGPQMAAGERVRLVYVGATPVVSVRWRGAPLRDLVALPAAHDIANMLFGVAVSNGQTSRITGTFVRDLRAWYNVAILRQRCAILIFASEFASRRLGGPTLHVL